MEEHNGKEPQNARININYSCKKPKISFSYPVDKKNAMRGTMFPIVFIGWMVLNTLPLMYVSFTSQKDLMPDFNNSKYNLSNYEEYSNYYLQEDRMNYSYTAYNKNFVESIKEVPKNLPNSVFYFVIYFVGGFCLIYFPFKSKWNKLFPDWQAFISPKKYKKFLSEDVKIDSNGKVFVELPIFSNVICDFNATKDFSKYLKEFSISEYEFLCYKLKKLKGKNKKGRKANEFIWYSKWYFTQKPKEGILEVVFK